MENSQESQIKLSPQSCNPILTLGGRVSQGTTLSVLAVVGVGAGLVLGWDSLVALGLSSFILALVPCALMCAVGLCASRMGNNNQTAAGTPPKTPGSNAHVVKAEPASEPNPPLPVNRI